nr:hypothetical protein DBT45_10935 [Aerococcus tenax]
MTDEAASVPPGDNQPQTGIAHRLQSLWRGLVGASSASDPTLRESLEEALEGRDEEGRGLTPEERHMLVNILSFGELRVDDVMVPRADVIAVDESDTLEEVLRLYRLSNHSRMPIYRETLDDPTGMVHIKDVIQFLIPSEEPGAEPKVFDLKAIRRDLLFVPPSMPALDLLVKMQATRIHLAAGPLFQRDPGGQAGTTWRAGAIMIQHIARDGGLTGHRESEDARPPSDEEENWNRASILLGTVEDYELLDPALAPARLLYRLFHEDGVRAYEPSDVAFGCRCSREHMESVLRSFGVEEIDEMVKDGVIEVTCEFCSEVYLFAPDELKEGLQ